jgi:ABC-type multidrug transport system fused ATPase/permease subunit
MESTLNRMEPLFERAEKYGKTSFELYKLKTISKTAEVVSTFVSHGAVIIVLSMFLVFASIGVALWLGGLLGTIYLGFFCIAAFYIMLGVVLYFFLHRTIQRKISNAIISQVLKK